VARAAGCIGASRVIGGILGANIVRVTIVACRAPRVAFGQWFGGGAQRGRRSAGAQGRRWCDRRKDLNRGAPRQGRDRSLLVRDEEIERNQHQCGKNRGDGQENAFALFERFGIRTRIGLPGLDLFQFQRVLVFHLLARQLAGEHRPAEGLDVDAVKMPHEDCQNGEKRFAAVRGFGGGNQIPRQKTRRVDRIPHHKTGDTHQHRTPHERPVLGFFLKGKTSESDFLFRQTQIIADDIQRVEQVVQAREHRPAHAQDKDLVRDDDAVINASQRHHDGGGVMNDAHDLDAAHQPNQRFRPTVAHEFLRHTGERQEGERDHLRPVFDALRERKAEILFLCTHGLVTPRFLQAVQDTARRVENDKAEHAADDDGDENRVEQINVIDRRILGRTGVIVTHPRRREISRRVGMALLAGLEQIFLDDTRPWIFHASNVVDAVTVVADRFVRRRVRRLLLEQLDGRTVKIGDIRVQHISREVVLFHLGFVGVAGRANLRRFQAERVRRWIGNVVDAVTANTGRHVGIGLIEQRRAVHGRFVLIEDRAVAQAARLRNLGTRVIGWRDVVRGMTIGADGGVAVARRDVFRVDRIELLLVHFVVTLAADGVHLQREIAFVARGRRGMRIATDVRVARGAALPLLAVHRRVELRFVGE